MTYHKLQYILAGRDPLLQIGREGCVLLIRLCMMDAQNLPMSLQLFLQREDITFVSWGKTSWILYHNSCGFESLFSCLQVGVAIHVDCGRIFTDWHLTVRRYLDLNILGSKVRIDLQACIASF